MKCGYASPVNVTALPHPQIILVKGIRTQELIHFFFFLFEATAAHNTARLHVFLVRR